MVKIIEILRYLKRLSIHRIHYWKWIFGNRKTPQDFYAEATVSIAARWEGEIDPLLTYTGMFDKLRQRKFSGSFWELGGGYSTILAPLSLRIPMSSIHSIDFDPMKYHRILNNRANSKKFLSQINLYPKLQLALSRWKHH